MYRPILFNHIPRTGGTTLRVILGRVYGKEKIFFINSRDIAGSLDTFRAMSLEERNNYRLISGHGAENFAEMQENPFRISILREPIALFISQYYYLRKSPNSNFLPEVSSLSSLDEYIDYAIEHGQDNMMTRLLSGQNESLINQEIPASNMDIDGESMIKNAIKMMEQYDAVFDLGSFDRGIFRLSELLNWKRIPLYRPLNMSDHPSLKQLKGKASLDRLNHVLRFDLALYRAYMEGEHFKTNKKSAHGYKYLGFQYKQKAAKTIAVLLGKK